MLPSRPASPARHALDHDAVALLADVHDLGAGLAGLNHGGQGSCGGVEERRQRERQAGECKPGAEAYFAIATGSLVSACTAPQLQHESSA